MGQNVSALGVVRAVVWPTYAGVYDQYGVEPWSSPDYQRVQIRWEFVKGVLKGRTMSEILTPPGVFTQMLFSHTPTGLVAAVRHFDKPFIFRKPGSILLKDIVEQDFTTLADVPLLKSMKRNAKE